VRVMYSCLLGNVQSKMTGVVFGNLSWSSRGNSQVQQRTSRGRLSCLMPSRQEPPSKTTLKQHILVHEEPALRKRLLSGIYITIWCQVYAKTANFS
jgi:hypothetical protein